MRKSVCALALLAIGIAGCLTPSAPKTSGSSNSDNSNTTPTLSLPGGAKAVRVIFKEGNENASFVNCNATSGSPLDASGIRTGCAATTFYDTANTMMTRPDWLTSVTVSISGANNEKATKPTCARFGDNNDKNATCDFDNDAGATTAAEKCSVQSSHFRVSERSCVSASDTAIATGTGIKDDPVFIRATFNRSTSYLGASENIMVAVEYSATSYHSPRNFSNPTSCFSLSGTPAIEECADFTWKVFLRAAAATTPVPFMTFLPPANDHVDATNNRGGGSILTKQIILPLASDSTLDTFQLSRIKSILNSTASDWTTFDAVCDDNSAFCAGLVIYSMTFFRI